MGMTIDDADTILSCERLNSGMRCGASDEEIDEALGVAIETMQKYQEIQEIYQKWNRNYGIQTSSAWIEVIEALEQDPFINKPCISTGVCEHDKNVVLDKIGAEIEEYKSRQLTLATGVDDLEKGKQIALEYVLAVLDKYKTESEG